MNTSGGGEIFLTLIHRSRMTSLPRSPHSSVAMLSNLLSREVMHSTLRSDTPRIPDR